MSTFSKSLLLTLIGAVLVPQIAAQDNAPNPDLDEYKQRLSTIKAMEKTLLSACRKQDRLDKPSSGIVKAKPLSDEEQEVLNSFDAGKEYVALGTWALQKQLVKQAEEAYLLAQKTNPGLSKPYEAFRGKDFDATWKGILGKIKTALKTAERKASAIDRKVKRNADLAEKKKKTQPIKTEEKRFIKSFNAAEATYQLGALLKDRSEEKDAETHFLHVLKLDPDHKQAHLALGHVEYEGVWYKTEIEKKKAVEVKTLLRKFVSAKDETEKNEIWAKLTSEYGYSTDKSYYEHCNHYAKSPKGLILDKELELDKDKYPGKYSIKTPAKYDVLKRHPLIIFLHGGGKGVGDNKEYRYMWNRGPSENGFFVAAPTVITKGDAEWNRKQERDYVMTVVKEMVQNYPIDPTRIYLCGHSMGGGGTFSIGPQNVNVFAAIVPMSGWPSQDLKPLKNTHTFIIHGKDDMTVKVGGSRRAAKSLKDWKYPYRYDEIDGHGHGIPHDKWMDAVEWLKDKRLHPEDAKNIPAFYVPYMVETLSKKK